MCNYAWYINREPKTEGSPDLVRFVWTVACNFHSTLWSMSLSPSLSKLQEPDRLFLEEVEHNPKPKYI